MEQLEKQLKTMSKDLETVVTENIGNKHSAAEANLAVNEVKAELEKTQTSLKVKLMIPRFLLSSE